MNERISSITGVMVALCIFALIGLIVWFVICVVRKKNKKISLISIGIDFALIIIFTIIGSTAYSKTDAYQDYLAQKAIDEAEKKEQEKMKQEQREADEERKAAEQASIVEAQEKADDEAEEAVTNEPVTTSEQIAEEKQEEPNETTENNIFYTDVFFDDISLNPKDYENQHIRTAFTVSSSYESDDGSYISSDYHYGQKEIKAYPDNWGNIDADEYVTITGTLSIGEYDSVEMVDAHIENVGDAAKTYFKEQEEKYLQEFVEEAQKVSYDDLNRYPETYEGEKIKINVKITKVETDGLIFDGTIWGSVNGNEITMSDYRTTQEPRLIEGDNVTIYAIANGRGKVKQYDKSGLIPKKVDEYEVPNLWIKYAEF